MKSGVLKINLGDFVLGASGVSSLMSVILMLGAYFFLAVFSMSMFVVTRDLPTHRTGFGIQLNGLLINLILDCMSNLMAVDNHLCLAILPNIQVTLNVFNCCDQKLSLKLIV